MDEFPVFVRVTDCLLLLPCVTFPKADAEGLADSCKLCLTPVPLRATASGDWGALLAMLTVPVVLEALAGEKRTLNARDCPGVSVAGSVGPVIPNPLPAIVPCEIIKLAFPESLIVRV